MPNYVALLRAVNVGGTGKLPMTELAAMCADAGFTNVKTYIASGNVVFTCKQAERGVRAALEQRLERYANQHISVLVRTAEEITAVHRDNPFKRAAPNRTVAIFLNEAPSKDTLVKVKGRSTEEIALGAREFYVSYGDRMADSKLRIPGAELGTARNMNTIAKLASMATELTPTKVGSR